MDLLKNPFHILGATTRDNRHRIMDLAEENSLLSDADACMEAQSILITPRRRISAEVAWLPGVDPSFYGILFRYLESPNEELPNITMAPTAIANLRATKLSRHPGLSSSNIVEWILTIAQTSESINSETVCAVLNGDRRASGLPEITDLSTVDDAIRNQKRYYSQTVTSVLENLSVNARARTMTLLLETATSNGRYQCPTLIKDLIPAYQFSVQDSLEQNKRIIEAQDEQLRAMADANNPDTTLVPIVDQLLESVKEWDILAQPIQLSQRSTGQRHDASFEIAWRFRKLAADLFREYRKSDFSRKILNTLQDVFSEVPEIVEGLTEVSIRLEEEIRYVRIVERVEELKDASDAEQLDDTLTQMVTQLIQTVKTWDTSTPPIEANNGVAIIVRNLALHLWNEHQKLDFAIRITNALIGVFNGVYGMDEVNNRLSQDITTLTNISEQRRQNRPEERRQNRPEDRGLSGCLVDKIIGYAVVFGIFGILALIGSLMEGC